MKQVSFPEVPYTTSLNVMVHQVPWQYDPECMTHDAMPDEALEKLHNFMHLRHGLPVTWIADLTSAQYYQREFSEWKREYGDEIGIYEMAVWSQEIVKPGVQDWVEAAGMQRPSRTKCNLPGAHAIESSTLFCQLPEAEQNLAFAYLKKKYDEILGQNTRLAYGACGDASTLRAMRRAGLDIFWGFLWNLFGDKIDSTGKGCPPQPFYPSDIHVKAAADRGEKPVLGMHWAVGDYLNNFAAGRCNHTALCWAAVNPHDMTNRSGTVDKRQFFTRFWTQMAENVKWNPFIHAPLQIEAHWLDESGNFYAHAPAFPPRTSEMLFYEIETILRTGASFVTSECFADWFFSKFETTPEILIYLEDSLADSKLPGKEPEKYGPILIDSSRKRQQIFLRDMSFNAVRSYDYTNPAPAQDPCAEYPYALESDIQLLVKHWTSPSFGIRIFKESVQYCANDLALTSGKDEPDYSMALWQANIPDYVTEKDLELSPNIKRVRLIREKNVALVDASLKQGDNVLLMSSAKPGEWITVHPAVYHPRRVEFFIENRGGEVAVTSFAQFLKPNLEIGGFWWDGEYFETLSQFANSAYNFQTGGVSINCCYPEKLILRGHGDTRVSFEILGEIPKQFLP